MFSRCYIPCNPTLAGNPVFFIDENQIFCCGFDLSDFFDRESSLFRSSDPVQLSKQRSESGKAASTLTNYSRRSLDAVTGGRTPRWVEFWSDAAVDRRRRNSNSSSPDRYFEIPRLGVPEWVNEYIDRVGSVLKEGGWAESDVEEIKNVSASGFLDGEMMCLDNQGLLDALLLKTDRFSDSLQKAGWSSEEVSDVFGFDFRIVKEKKQGKKLPPELVERIGKLAETASFK